MSNPMFENPKVALGFAGVIVAVALVASVAFKEFSKDDQALGQTLEAQEATPAPVAIQQPQGGHNSVAAIGWADDEEISDDWGAPVASTPKNSDSEIPIPANNAPVFGDRDTQSVENSTLSSPNGPIITSSAAPGAPPVSPPPEIGNQPPVIINGG